MVSKKKRDAFTKNDIELTKAMESGIFGYKQAFRLRLLGSHCLRIAIQDCLDNPEHDKPESFLISPHV